MEIQDAHHQEAPGELLKDVQCHRAQGSKIHMAVLEALLHTFPQGALKDVHLQVVQCELRHLVGGGLPLEAQLGGLHSIVQLCGNLHIMVGLRAVQQEAGILTEEAILVGHMERNLSVEMEVIHLMVVMMGVAIFPLPPHLVVPQKVRKLQLGWRMETKRNI